MFMKSYFKKLASQLLKQRGKNYKYSIDLKTVNYNSYHRDMIQVG